MRLASTKLCRGRRKGVIRRLDFRLGVIGAGRWQERALGLCILLHSSCIVLASDVLGCRDDTAIYVTMGIVPNSALRMKMCKSVLFSLFKAGENSNLIEKSFRYITRSTKSSSFEVWRIHIIGLRVVFRNVFRFLVLNNCGPLCAQKAKQASRRA